MKKPFLYLTPFLLIILTFSFCKTVTYTADNLPTRQLYFGSGGGFTGAVSEYLVLENGQIFKHLSETSYDELKKTKKKTAEGFYATYDELKLNELQFVRPGNMYFFLRMVDGDKEHYISWGDHNKNTYPKVKELHLNLMKTLK